MTDLLHIVCPQCDTINRMPESKLHDLPKCGKCKQSLFNAHPLMLSEINFNKHISNSHIPVIVDFWAPWCGPCRMMAPIFEQAAVRLEPKVRLAKLNTEQEPMIASQLAVQSIPTLIIFNRGREVARQSGAMGLDQLINWVNSNISK